MDLNFMFFQLPPALKLIFNLNYIPQRENFKELTPDQYKSFYEKTSEEDRVHLEGQKIYAFIPDDPKIYNRVVNLYQNDLVVVGESEIRTFEMAGQFIENYVKDSNRDFETLTDKLAFVSSLLPDVFSEGTPYAIYGQRKVKKRPKD